MPLLSVEEQIKKAMEEGEFDDLPGAGRRLDLEDYFQTPEHLRMAYSMLKNNNFVPPEVELLREAEALKAELDSTTDEGWRRALARQIAEKRTKVAFLLEQNRRAK